MPSTDRIPADVAAALAAADAATDTSAETMAAVWRAAVAAGGVSAELAAPYVDRLWFTVWRGDPGERVRARESSWMAPLRRADIELAGHRVATYTGGDGPAVVLVHGWGDYAGRMGAFVAPLLGRGLSVATVDLPAHGESPGTQTNLYEMADVVAALVRQADARVVVGHSIGGMTAVFAACQTDPPPALALLAPAVRMENALATFGKLFQLPAVTVEGLRASVERRFGAGVWDDLHADRIARALDVPALVVHDHDDDQVSVDDGRLLAAALPRATLVETSGLGHAKLIRNDAVIASVVDFVVDSLALRAT